MSHPCRAWARPARSWWRSRKGRGPPPWSGLAASKLLLVGDTRSCLRRRGRGYRSLVERCRLTRRSLRDTPLIAGRRKSGGVSEGRGERARGAEADRNSDIGHGGGGLRQQNLRVLHSTVSMKSVRRDAERFLERPTKVVGTQSDELGEGGERDLLRQMLFDMRNDGTLLPGRETAPGRQPRAAGTRIEPHELVRQDSAERFAIEPVAGLRAIDHRLQLGRYVPDRRVLEEQPWGKRYGTTCRIRSDRKRRRIEIKMCSTDQTARLLPIIVFMTGRHEDELPLVVSQRGPRQALDEGEPVAALARFEHNEHVDRSSEATLDSGMLRDMHNLRRHAIPVHGVPPYGFCGRKLDQRSDRVELGLAGRQANGVVIGSLIGPFVSEAARRVRQAGIWRRPAISGSARNHGRCVRIHRHVVTIWAARLRCL